MEVRLEAKRSAKLRLVSAAALRKAWAPMEPTEAGTSKAAREVQLWQRSSPMVWSVEPGIKEMVWTWMAFSKALA